jgi:hypothetical protein
MQLWAATGTLETLYKRVVAKTKVAVEALPRLQQSQLRGELPWHLQEESNLSMALVENAVYQPYFDLDVGIFAHGLKTERVYQAHPELHSRIDEDGLLPVEGFDAGPQVLMHAGSALHYHPLLRRHFTSHINDTLLSTVLKAAEDTRADARIALNEQHFMPAAEFREYMEADYWFGPPLSPATLDDPMKVGVTVHGDPQQGLTHEYPGLLVDWRLDKEGRKVVQIEELSEHASAQQAGLRLLRYLHAIRDIESGVFIHCDGAVRAYTPAQYEARKTKLYVTGRTSASRYRKLFRLDGVISTETWSNVAAQWFRHNRLILEYLHKLEG